MNSLLVRLLGQEYAQIVSLDGELAEVQDTPQTPAKVDGRSDVAVTT